MEKIIEIDLHDKYDLVEKYNENKRKWLYNILKGKRKIILKERTKRST